MASKYRPRRTKGNVSAEAAFWKVLTKTAPANEISLSQVDLSPLGQRHVQLFEVLEQEMSLGNVQISFFHPKDLVVHC
jgi:hypothetical protein